MSNKKLIAFEDAGELKFGFLKEEQRGNIIFTLISGEETKLPTSRCYLFPEAENPIENLNNLLADAKKLIPEISAAKAWEKFKGSDSVSTQKICEFILKDNNTHNHLATYLALIEDSLFFKRKNNLFFPRSAETIEELKQSRLEKEFKDRELEQTTTHFLSDEINLTNIPDCAKRIIHNLKLLAVHSHHLSPADRRECGQIINKLKEKYALSGTLEAQALCLLKKVPLIGPREHLLFEKYLWPQEFSRKALAEAKKTAQKLKTISELLPKAKDFRDLECYTIDDPKTMDIDDAVHLRQTANGFELGVHISLVAALIDYGSGCEQEAKDRATSIYTSDRVLNMLPTELAENFASLLPDQERPVLSCLINTDNAGNIIDYKVTTAIIKSSGRLSYEELKNKLEKQDVYFTQIYKIAKLHEEYRFSNQAIRSQKDYSEIYLNEAGELKLKVTSENDIARSLIAELMIMANRFFADFSAKNFIPVFFRGQEEEKEDEKTNANEQSFTPSFIEITPQKHSGLGLPAYIQATSPIRRYQDLCNQRQILSFLLTQKPALQRKDLERIQRQIFYPIKTASQITKEAKRFWTLQYISENYPTGHVFNALLLKNDKKLAMVQLKEIYFITLCDLPKDLKPKAELRLKLIEVNPIMNKLELVLLSEPTPAVG